MYALAADCSIGSAGSAILMTHSRAAQGEPALIYLKLFPLTGDSDMVSHFMGVQIDLPLTPAEREALLTHCNNTAAASSASGGSVNGNGVQVSSQGNQGHRQEQPQQGPGYGHQGHGQRHGQPHGVNDVSSNEQNRAQGRSHGEMLYQYQQQQYHLHQERISEAQMQQAYYSLSAASQDAQNGQGGSFEDLCAGQDASGAPCASSSSSRGGERSSSRRESAASSPQQHVKDEQEMEQSYAGRSQGQGNNHGQVYQQPHAQGQGQGQPMQRRGGDSVDCGSYTSNSNAAYGNYDQPQQDESYNHFSNSSSNRSSGSGSGSARGSGSGSGNNAGSNGTNRVAGRNNGINGSNSGAMNVTSGNSNMFSGSNPNPNSSKGTSPNGVCRSPPDCYSDGMKKSSV
jgi:hypothetical protein